MDSTRELGEIVTIRGVDGSSARISMHGAHVTSWLTADGVERLFLSSRAAASGGSAIRGGVPVCFPQFADVGSLPKHGFARTQAWTHIGGGCFALETTADSWPGWPHPCRLHLAVTLGAATMTCVLTVENTGTEPFSFTGALHTYLRCDDITSVSVRGLNGRAVRSGGFVHGDIAFGDAASDVDLSVFAVQKATTVIGLQRGEPSKVVCAQTGFPDVVVWNIGRTLAAEMADLGPEEWRNYVCVEAAAVENPVVLASLERWVGTQTLVIESEQL